MFEIRQGAREELVLGLGESARRGVRKMFASTLEAYLKAAKDERDEAGRVLVVRNGYAREREILSAGVTGVRPPRLNDKRVDDESSEAEEVQERDPAALVPARLLPSGGLRAGARGALRYQLGALRYEHPAYH